MNFSIKLSQFFYFLFNISIICLLIYLLFDINLTVFGEEVKIFEINNSKFVKVHVSNYDRHAYPIYKIYSYTFNSYRFNNDWFHFMYQNMFYKIEYMTFSFKKFLTTYFFINDEDILRQRYTLYLIDYVSYMKWYHSRFFIALSNRPELFISNVYRLNFVYGQFKNLFYYDNIDIYLNNLYSYQLNLKYPFGVNYFNNSFKNNNWVFLYFEYFFINLYMFIFFLVFVYLFMFLYFSFFINLYSSKLYSGLGYYLSINLSDEDDDFIGYYDYLLEWGLYQRLGKYYNIVKYETFYVNFLISSNLKVYKWFNLSEIKTIKYSQYKNLNFSLTVLMKSQISIVPWAYEIFPGEIDPMQYLPYSMIDVSFPESNYYYKTFNLLKMEIDDIAYEKISYNETDIYGIKIYDTEMHPLHIEDLTEQKDYLSYESSKFRADLFFKTRKNDSYYVDRFVTRYIKIINRAIDKLVSIDSSIVYNGTLNNREEIMMRSLEGGLNLFITNWYLYEKNVTFFTFYDEELEEYEGYIETKDLRYKLVPNVWRQFTALNFFMLIVQPALGHFFIRSSPFWEDYGQETESDTLEEERYLLESDSAFLGKFNSTEKISSLFGFGMGKQKNSELFNFGSILSCENLEYVNKYYKYPPYESFIGYLLIPPEYRFFKGLSSFGEFTCVGNKILEKNKLLMPNFLIKKKNDLLIDNTYFLGVTGYPEGLTFLSDINDLNLYNNSNVLYNESVQLMEEREVDNEKFYYVKDAKDFLLFAYAIPVLSVTTYILLKIIEFLF